MVVLSAAVISTGKTLVARQFVEMTRLRIEGLLSAFQKLVDSGRDHTFIETETVRYLYQPMESLHLLVITNKSSNILEDLETLRLLAKVVQDCCQIQVNEENVLKHAFDIVFSFDEVVSFGHRESVTLSQIKSYTEMDSHEEKLHQMIEQSKINEAREMAKKKQLELKKARLQDGGGSGPKMDGFGGGGPDGPSSMSSPSISSFQSTMSSMGGDSGSRGGGGGGGGGMMEESAPAWTPSMSTDSGAVIKPKEGPKKGMLLGKKKPGDIFGPSEPAPSAAAQEAVVEQAPAAAAYNPLMDPVRVEIEEKITADLQVEGGLNGEVTCMGQFQVTVLDAAKADLVCFKLAPQSQDFKYKVHPNLNKASHAANLLEVRDATKAYRANTPAPLLKWQSKSGDEDFLPVTISCWPSSTADGTQMVLELELTDMNVSLEEVYIRFPATASSRPIISSCSPGEAGYDAAAGQVVWRIPVLDKTEASGTLEFSASADSASLLPGSFEAVRRGQTKCPMDILECYHQERKDQISYTLEKVSVYALRIGA
ncbi:unnamed protein product [Polarella glacialis]|uniref:Coatomer subunit delta n=1 Tax=Polarella glacialis TaxID=89957 RepID=A0A813DHX1_POLGL|nr:unnamed protein product [Polarella glacialis]CAE8727399.1 unnamed protein product [Polarella glacialis]